MAIKKKDVKIQVSFGDILDSGNWDDFCDKYGYNPYFINEGKGSKCESTSISLDDAERWGLIER